MRFVGDKSAKSGHKSKITGTKNDGKDGNCNSLQKCHASFGTIYSDIGKNIDKMKRRNFKFNYKIVNTESSVSFCI